VGRRQTSRATSRSSWCTSNAASGSTDWTCGVVTIRQLPETDKGAIFIAFEDEIGSGSTHLIARRLVDVTPWLGSLASSSRDSDLGPGPAGRSRSGRPCWRRSWRGARASDCFKAINSGERVSRLGRSRASDATARMIAM
jgi:hypothetical protein